jgi:sterol desaturase/sphingolipid hydroxylase (fatty acid hydroxylase superfamily)
MSYDGRRDYKMVLFPPVMLFFFLGAIAAPVGGALFLVASGNVAWLYAATAMGFLTYEWLHFCHHLPEDAWIARRRPLRKLRSHHQTHHDPSAMTACNFNITFPICDTLFGTRREGIRP